mgnify:CR=1 FL=1
MVGHAGNRYSGGNAPGTQLLTCNKRRSLMKIKAKEKMVPHGLVRLAVKEERARARREMKLFLEEQKVRRLKSEKEMHEEERDLALMETEFLSKW